MSVTCICRYVCCEMKVFLFDLLIKPCSDERQNGFKGLKLKSCKFLQPFSTPCEHDCFCLKTLKHFCFKCLRWFLKIKFFWFLNTVLGTLKTSFRKLTTFFWFPIVFFFLLLKLKLQKQMKIILTFCMKTAVVLLASSEWTKRDLILICESTTTCSITK